MSHVSNTNNLKYAGMHKIIFNTLLIALLLMTTNCSDNKSIKLVESWKVGTSSGVLKEFSQEEFNKLKSVGIEYIELSSGVFKNKSQAEREEFVGNVKQMADKAGIKVWSIHLPFSSVYDISTLHDEDRTNMIKECSEIMSLCKPLNPEKYVIHPSAEPIEDAERGQRIANSIASLKILTDEVKKHNAKLALECLPRTCLGNTSDELLMLVNEVGNEIEVCFDSNHLLKEKPEDFVAKAGSLITTVHMSDFDGLDEKHWLPGEGVINWNNVISELVKAGYKGPFMFETSRRKPSPVTNERERLTPEDLVTGFRELKNNYIRSFSANNRKLTDS